MQDFCLWVSIAYITYPLILGFIPLHWAAIRGNLTACRILVQAGKKDDLMMTDNSGLTPQQHASDRNHQQVTNFLVGINSSAQNSLVIFISFHSTS